MYCFSYFQKRHTVKGYTEGVVRSVNPEKVINLFECARTNNTAGVSATERQFFPYIQDRRIMQWGGLADEFDEYERRYGLTLELLRYFDQIDYPLSFSTKAAWWTEDERYMELFRRHTHNWHTKISIITMNEAKARQIEKGVPTPKERIEAIRRLAAQGNRVTLRLRPYIIGASEDYAATIKAAHEAGADSVTTEFFCMESRADDRLKKRYAAISKVVGYDIHKFYMENSRQAGYKRLNREVKAPVIRKMREIAHGYGMRFHVSDAFCRECNDACNCCGVPPEWNVSQKGNIGQAIITARDTGRVTWKDIAEPIKKYFGFGWVAASGFNTGSNKARALLYDTTMAQWLRHNWNNVKAGTSPARGYGGILVPDGKDEDGDVIYRFESKKRGEENAEG
jgi:DNA repair photolyase